MSPQHFELGDKVKDRVTGFTGICIYRCEFLNGCVQYGVKPATDKDGKNIEAEGVDSQQLELVDKGLNKVPKIAPKKTFTGGSMQDAPKGF